MGERQRHQSFHEEAFQSDEQWVVMKGDSEPSFEDSISGSSCSSDQDVMEDATSSSSSSYGPLYELSELMAHLPIKRGLSKYYEGKSQTFASLSSLESLEGLAKKKLPSYRSRKMKSCKSVYSPKATICKKSTPPRVSFLSSLPNCNSGRSRRGTLLSKCRPLFYVSENL